jgi:hypothetical protein
MCGVAVLCLLPGAAFADRVKVALPQASFLTASCVVDAANAAGLPLAALVGVLATENGRAGEALRNDNGTWDMGPFQVNTVHVNELAAMGIAPEAVLRDGCANAYAAAWLLRREYNRTGDIWQAIGAYHSRTPHRRDAYIARVKANLVRLAKSGRAGFPALPPFAAGREGEQ